MLVLHKAKHIFLTYGAKLEAYFSELAFKKEINKIDPAVLG